MGMLVFSSAMKAIPKSQFYASEVDGASRWQQIRYIILPQMRWPILFVTCYQTLSLLASFNEILLSTRGGPGKATEVWSLAAYHTALNNYAGNLEYGLGAAMALVLVVIGVVLSLIYLRIFNYDTLISQAADRGLTMAEKPQPSANFSHLAGHRCCSALVSLPLVLMYAYLFIDTVTDTRRRIADPERVHPAALALPLGDADGQAEHLARHPQHAASSRAASTARRPPRLVDGGLCAVAAQCACARLLPGRRHGAACLPVGHAHHRHLHRAADGSASTIR